MILNIDFKNMELTTFSTNEIILFKRLNLSDKLIFAYSENPAGLWKRSAIEYVLNHENISSNVLDSLSKGLSAVESGRIFRMTEEFEKLIEIKND
jgi:hypothetical protein